MGSTNKDIREILERLESKIDKVIERMDQMEKRNEEIIEKKSDKIVQEVKETEKMILDSTVPTIGYATNELQGFFQISTHLESARRFCIMMVIMYDPSTLVLKKYLNYVVEKSPQKTIKHFLENEVNDKSLRKRLKKAELKKLEKCSDVMRSDLDVALMYLILRYCDTSHVKGLNDSGHHTWSNPSEYNSDDSAHIFRIKDIRNNMAHACSTELEEDEYKERLQKVRNGLLQLSGRVSAELRTETEEKIDEITKDKEAILSYIKGNLVRSYTAPAAQRPSKYQYLINTEDTVDLKFAKKIFKDEYSPAVTKKVTIDDFFKDRLVLLLGKPGSGKSTTFSQLCSKFTKNQLTDFDLVVRVNLKDCQKRPYRGFNPNYLFDILVKNNVLKEIDRFVFESAVNKRKCLWLFDGYDEVRKDVKDAMKKSLFETTWNYGKVVLSSRHYDIEGSLAQVEQQDITRVDICDLETEEEKRNILVHSLKKNDVLVDDFLKAIKENDGPENFLSKMTNTPLGLCNVFHHWESKKRFAKNNRSLLDAIVLQKINTYLVHAKGPEGSSDEKMHAFLPRVIHFFGHHAFKTLKDKDLNIPFTTKEEGLENFGSFLMREVQTGSTTAAGIPLVQTNTTLVYEHKRQQEHLAGLYIAYILLDGTIDDEEMNSEELCALKDALMFAVGKPDEGTNLKYKNTDGESVGGLLYKYLLKKRLSLPEDCTKGPGLDLLQLHLELLDAISEESSAEERSQIRLNFVELLSETKKMTVNELLANLITDSSGLQQSVEHVEINHSRGVLQKLLDNCPNLAMIYINHCTTEDAQRLGEQLSNKRLPRLRTLRIQETSKEGQLALLLAQAGTDTQSREEDSWRWKITLKKGTYFAKYDTHHRWTRKRGRRVDVTDTRPEVRFREMPLEQVMELTNNERLDVWLCELLDLTMDDGDVPVTEKSFTFNVNGEVLWIIRTSEFFKIVNHNSITLNFTYLTLNGLDKEDIMEFNMTRHNNRLPNLTDLDFMHLRNPPSDVASFVNAVKDLPEIALFKNDILKCIYDTCQSQNVKLLWKYVYLQSPREITVTTFKDMKMNQILPVLVGVYDTENQHRQLV